MKSQYWNAAESQICFECPTWKGKKQLVPLRWMRAAQVTAGLTCGQLRIHPIFGCFRFQEIWPTSFTSIFAVGVLAKPWNSKTFKRHSTVPWNRMTWECCVLIQKLSKTDHSWPIPASSSSWGFIPIFCWSTPLLLILPFIWVMEDRSFDIFRPSDPPIDFSSLKVLESRWSGPKRWGAHGSAVCAAAADRSQWCLLWEPTNLCVVRKDPNTSTWEVAGLMVLIGGIPFFELLVFWEENKRWEEEEGEEGDEEEE